MQVPIKCYVFGLGVKDIATVKYLLHYGDFFKDYCIKKVNWRKLHNYQFFKIVITSELLFIRRKLQKINSFPYKIQQSLSNHSTIKVLDQHSRKLQKYKINSSKRKNFCRNYCFHAFYFRGILAHIMCFIVLLCLCYTQTKTKKWK